MITKENARDFIPLLEALADGELQFFYSFAGWKDVNSVIFKSPVSSYRRKPKPREFWCTVYKNEVGNIYMTREEALSRKVGHGDTIRVREIID